MAENLRKQEALTDVDKTETTAKISEQADFSSPYLILEPKSNQAPKEAVSTNQSHSRRPKSALHIKPIRNKKK